MCLGLPGALPFPNRAGVEAAVRLGLALGCKIAAQSVFARKNYFYPDMPKNYQITQYDRPLCEGGALPVRVGEQDREFALIRIHLEEDTGKSFHPEKHGDRRVSRVDFNRAGVPLLEMVTRPDFRGSAECAAFLTTLRRLVRWLGISDGDMEKGQLRCDANVSLRPAGSETFGTKTEIKNLNSIRGVERAITAEIAPADCPPCGWRAYRAGHAPLRRRIRSAGGDALQGTRARLPLLPGARPAAARSGRGLDRPCSRGDSRAAVECARHAGRAISRCPRTTPAY